jgi:hypothetical protein
MWSQIRGFGLAGDRVDQSQMGARIGELGRVEMSQQMSDRTVGPKEENGVSSRKKMVSVHFS